MAALLIDAPVPHFCSYLFFNFLGKIDQVCNRQWNCGASHLPVGNCASHRLPGCKFSSPIALWRMFRWTGSHRSRQAGFFNKWNSRKAFYICGKKCCYSVLFSMKGFLKVLGIRKPLIFRPFGSLCLLSHLKQFRVRLQSDDLEIQDTATTLFGLIKLVFCLWLRLVWRIQILPTGY